MPRLSLQPGEGARVHKEKSTAPDTKKKHIGKTCKVSKIFIGWVLPFLPLKPVILWFKNCTLVISISRLIADVCVCVCVCVLKHGGDLTQREGPM